MALRLTWAPLRNKPIEGNLEGKELLLSIYDRKQKRILKSGPPKQADIPARGAPCLAIMMLDTISETHI